MTAEQHLTQAREYLEYAHKQEGRDYQRAAALAAIATAHAQIAQAMQAGVR